MRKVIIVGLKVVALALIASCGGGDEAAPGAFTPNPAPSPGTRGPTLTYTPGVYPAASTVAAQCQTPRTGIDPSTGSAYPDRAGSVTAENHWLRSWTRSLYLWYREVPDTNPALVSSTDAYFDQMQTTATLPSGQRKDRFHFTYDTAQYQQQAQSGIAVGYGISWHLGSASPPRRAVVAFVEPGSPAAFAGVMRGAELLLAGGADVVNGADVDTINAAMWPETAGVRYQFQFRSRNGVLLNTGLTAAAVTASPVPTTAVIPTSNGNLGYLLFNDHNKPAEAALVSAVNTLNTAGIQDLVLDLRYNGGGYLSIASQLAYMIAGPARTNGLTFERTQFNDQHTVTNPVTGQTLTPVPFLSTTRGLSLPAGQALPTLNLSRLYVLTGNGTCSASESIINGLRGIGVTVYQFGPDTCGKPYGFYPADNCGTTYFSIQFKGVNAASFGDYFEGFSATRVNGDAGARLPGCAASDDFTRDLGDPNEERLRVARVYRDLGVCSGTSLLQEPQAAVPGGPAISPPAAAPWRNNRILQ